MELGRLTGKGMVQIEKMIEVNWKNILDTEKSL